MNTRKHIRGYGLYDRVSGKCSRLSLCVVTVRHHRKASMLVAHMVKVPLVWKTPGMPSGSSIAGMVSTTTSSCVCTASICTRSSLHHVRTIPCDGARRQGRPSSQGSSSGWQSVDELSTLETSAFYRNQMMGGALWIFFPYTHCQTSCTTAVTQPCSCAISQVKGHTRLSYPYLSRISNTVSTKAGVRQTSLYDHAMLRRVMYNPKV